MAQEIIDIGVAANDGSGDPLRGGGEKINANFTELYNFIVALQAAAVALSEGKLSLSGGAMTGDLSLGGNTINDVGAPVLPADAVNLDFLLNSILVAQRGLESSIYETLDRGVGLFITDEGGRVLFRHPDPATAVNSAAVTALQSNYAASDMFETLSPSAGAWILDAGGRVLARLADAAMVEANTAAIEANTAAIAALQTYGLLFSIYETLDRNVAFFVTDTADRIVQTIYGTDPTLTATVASNTANIATITNRIASVVSVAGAPLINPLQADMQRHVSYRLAKLSQPTVEPITFGDAAGGDSWTQNAARWIDPFVEKMQAKFGDGGMGFTSFGFLNTSAVAPWTGGNQPNFVNGNARPSRYPCRLYGNMTSSYYTGAGPDISLTTFSQAGDAVEIDFPAGHPNTVGKLLHTDVTGAQARYTINGGASWTNLALGPGGTGLLTSTAINLPVGAGTLRIEWVAGNFGMAGAFARGASGYYMSKIAATGSRVSQFAGAVATSWENGLAALEPNRFIYMDGTNSQGAAVTRASWGASLQTVVNRARAAVPGIDVLIATPSENLRTGNAIAMTEYALEARSRAISMRFAYVDMQNAFGDPLNPTEYGSTGAIPLMNADLIHPQPLTGGRSLDAEFYNVTYRGF